jgi:hypothetical protein
VTRASIESPVDTVTDKLLGGQPWQCEVRTEKDQVVIGEARRKGIGWIGDDRAEESFPLNRHAVNWERRARREQRRKHSCAFTTLTFICSPKSARSAANLLTRPAILPGLGLIYARPLTLRKQ